MYGIADCVMDTNFALVDSPPESLYQYLESVLVSKRAVRGTDLVLVDSQTKSPYVFVA